VNYADDLSGNTTGRFHLCCTVCWTDQQTRQEGNEGGKLSQAPQRLGGFNIAQKYMCYNYV